MSSSGRENDDCGDAPEREHDCCDWCGRGSCGRYAKCGGPTGPGIDEPYDFEEKAA